MTRRWIVIILILTAVFAFMWIPVRRSQAETSFYQARNISSKLDQVLANQEEILNRLGELKKQGSK
jgi:type II secretory pathway component PulM